MCTIVNFTEGFVLNFIFPLKTIVFDYFFCLLIINLTQRVHFLYIFFMILS